MLEAMNHEKKIRAVIWLDENVGYYLYVYEFNSDRPYRDYHCGTLDQAYAQAELEFGISKDKFKEVK
jgi:hypothetical protein